MSRLCFRIHPLFILLMTVLVAMGQGIAAACSVVAILLHEAAHAAVARVFGYHLDTVFLMPYGAAISGDLSGLQPKEEIAVAVAGPAFSLLLAVFGLALWQLFPASYTHTVVFVRANLSLGLMNLLPVFPMDGGRVLNGILTAHTHEKKAAKTVGIVGITVGSAAVAAACVGMLFGLSPTAAVVAVFMVASAVTGMRGVRYTAILGMNARRRSFKKGLAVRNVAVTKEVNLLSLMRLSDGRHYDLITVVDENLRVVQTLDENALLELASKHSPSTSLAEIL